MPVIESWIEGRAPSGGHRPEVCLEACCTITRIDNRRSELLLVWDFATPLRAVQA